MLIGSGLIAQAFARLTVHHQDACIYAAGVSNSSCTDTHEFSREHQRLSAALQQAAHVDAFVYFGTCSVDDPEARNTPYVQHKLAMEQLVSTFPNHLILRLPQVAGKTPNPHTLLNYLYNRITRSEAFILWRNASRNIIDVDDVAAITSQLIADSTMRNVMLNVANSHSYPMLRIVSAMEKAIGKPAIYEIAERGADYHIDNRLILPVFEASGVEFDDDYLDRVIDKYYGKSH
jgi:nucleoside-diphosphate-sugar epimerase